MIKKSTLRIITIAVAIITAILAATAYYSYQLPTTQTETLRLGAYRHVATYDYVAYLKPNIIYGFTTLRPGEGILYTSLVDNISISFEYNSIINPSATNRSVENQVWMQIESPGKWMKNLTAVEALELFKLSGGSEYALQIDNAALNAYVKAIDSEVGTSSFTYNLKVYNNISLVAVTPVKTISDSFNPQLTIGFKQDNNLGRYISIEPLVSTEINEITETQETTLVWVLNQRIATLVGTILSLIAFAALALLYTKSGPIEPRTVDDVLGQYKDMIMKAAQEPAMKTAVTVSSLGDLIKMAEILAKPVLHSIKEDEHTFSLVEGDIKYQYRVKEAELTKRK
uniref:DUF5305 domain-containing protein n=1 Tax=Candidatus Methanomethylicus mesodigestus TaxID=1867258 RepID=A0A7C3IT41_9CREN